MSFRQEMSGIALAVIAGAWASVAVGQGQGPGIESLLLPDPDPAPAAKAAEPAATKPAEKVSEPEATKPATGKYKIVKEEKPAPIEPKTEKAAAKAPADKPAKPEVKAEAKPVETAPVPVAAKPAPKADGPKPETKAVKEEKAVPPVQKAEKKAEKPQPAPAVAAKPVEKKSTVAAKPEEKKPAAASAEVDEDTDEINLSEVDDSAVAAKGRPMVKLAPPTAAASATPEQPAADGKAPAKAPTAPETGSSIAARFLASDETALVDISSDDATLTDILRQFRRATGANIIYAESSNLHQRVSVSLKHVPWLEGMKSILNSRGFRVESSGGIHFVKEDKLAEPIFTRTFQLNHASVDELTKLFNESYGTKGKDGKIIKGIATPFQGANTIVVTANERVIADCEAIIKAVDKAVPQIYIEARFIELSSEAMHKLGLQWNQLESWGATVHDISAGASYANGRTGVYRNGHTDKYYTPTTWVQEGGTTTESFDIGDVSASRSTTTTPNIQDRSTGRSAFDYRQKDYLRQASDLAADSPMAWRNSRMFSGQLSVDDFNLAMSAFEQLQDTKIFSNPKVIVSNGKKANVDMTTKFPNIELTSQRNTSASASYLDMSAELKEIPGKDAELFAGSCFYSWGITLDVTPRISPDGLISVEIVPTISELDTDVTPNGFYAVQGADSSVGMFPIIRFKRITTDFTMKDGATAVIGGLSRTTEGDIDSGIPYLRKIPWIGPKLFGWKSRGKVQKEILVFVTVGIADPANLPEDVGLPKNAVRGREYVEKRAFEPGDRPNAADVLKLDMRPLDDRRSEGKKKSDEDVSSESGTVTITPVVPEKE